MPRIPENAPEGRAHTTCVDAWLERVDAGGDPDLLLAAFVRAFQSLWRRAQRTLGTITLIAITARVVAMTSQKYAFLGHLRADGAGLGCEIPAACAASLDFAELSLGLRNFLVEFLSIVGALTDEVLTPALHEALAATLTSSPSAAAEVQDSQQRSAKAPK